MRHAKSSWDDAGLSDFDRPLNGRGERTGPLIGELMRLEGFAPEIIISSPAERAKQTAMAVKKAGRLGGEIVFDERIYEASPSDLRQVAAEIDDVHASAMLVGHNPGVEGFISYLTGQLEPMPTAALAVVDLEIDCWDEITEGCGNLGHVFRPKELTSS